MKNILISGLCLIGLILAASCDNSIAGLIDNAKSAKGEVIIRISNSNGRTIMPLVPLFSRYELTLQKEGGESKEIKNTSGIESAGVTVTLTEGKWTITLTGYQEINGKNIPAAQGTYVLTISSGLTSYFAEIELKPFAINGSSIENGLFTFDITLPEGAGTAALSLKDIHGAPVAGFASFDLLAVKSGSAELAPGYYDMSIILTKNGGQFAGEFASVHIYSGLVSPANIDMSSITFTDKVYLAGELDGIRIGTIKITSDYDGTNVIKLITLDGSAAIRSDSWITDIPAVNIGKPVYIFQEFNGERASNTISLLEAKGHDGIKLNLIPASAEMINLAVWYSTITSDSGSNPHYAADENLNTYWNPAASSAEIIIDYGFDVTVNFSRLAFHSESGSTALTSYNVDYWDGNSWEHLVQRDQAFTGSQDGSVFYSNYFGQITAQKFRWNVSDGAAPAVIEFSLYKAANRDSLIAAIALAQDNSISPEISSDGKDVDSSLQWVTLQVKNEYLNAINTAKAARDNPYITDSGISDAYAALNAATKAFSDTKKDGENINFPEKEFEAYDGDANRFVVRWLTSVGYKYELYWSDFGGIGEVIYNSADGQDFTYPVIYVNDKIPGMIEVTVSASSGVTKYFVLWSTHMGTNQSEEVGRIDHLMTLGKPVLSLGEAYSYSTITAGWTPAQKADTYRLKYKYAGEDDWTVAGTFTADTLTHAFRPRGYNEIARSGKELQVRVEALNNTLKSKKGTQQDIYTYSDTVNTYLVGPAELDISAGKAEAIDLINVSWDKIPGAGGYYVVRRQFNMNNTSVIGSAVRYYVNASSAAVTGKNLEAGNADSSVTAAASITGSRFTLSDMYMTDAAYNGAYSSYAQSYRDQQNDMAQGFPYRYIVIPVINAGDFVDYDYYSYSLRENGETIQLSGAVSLEKTGFTIGFAQNVTATKGTYASTGNTNNGVQVTWDVPQTHANLGMTYAVYRKAHNGNWELAPNGITGDRSFVDTPPAGILYEYAVGIRHNITAQDIRGPSLPHNSSRFMAAEMTKVNNKGIPNLQGYMLPMVRMQGVTRGEDAEANAVFGERVTWYSAGIANGGNNTNWGVDGYTVYVMNRNINANWHVAQDNVTTNSVLLTPNNTPSVNNTVGVSRNLLFVLRDYKHFFKARSYSVRDDGVKIYSPDPAYTYTNGTASNPHFLETEYVKWGARQITQTEFAQIVSLYMARANQQDDYWGTTWAIVARTWRTVNASTNYGGGGSMRHSTNAGVTERQYEYRNWKTDLQTRAGDWMTFITVDGDIWIVTGASTRPHRYRRANNGYRNNRLVITGPSDTPHLYSGEVQFGANNADNNANNLRWADGTVHVIYPSGTSIQTFSLAGRDTAFMFSTDVSGTSNFNHLDNAWR